MENKRKLLHYRRAEFLNDPGRTLQQLIEESLAKRHSIKIRKENLSDNSEGESWARFINTHRSAMGMEFGAMVLLTPGQSKLIIGTNEAQDEVDVSQILAPENKEFLESILYYGIKDNHIIMLQSISLTSAPLRIKSKHARQYKTSE